MRIQRLGARAADRLSELRVGLRDARHEGAVEFLLRGLGEEVDRVLRRDHGTLGEHGLVDLEEARVLGERRPDLRVAAPDEGEDAGHAPQVLGEVLAGHRAAVAAHALGAQRFEDGLTAALARGGLILDLVVGDGVLGELRLGAMSLGDVHGDALYESGHELVGRRRIGANGALHMGLAGDDVARAACMQFAHGDHGGLVGGELAAHDRLQRVDDLGRHHHGVTAALRHGAVAGGAADVHAEPVGVGHARPGLAADGARVNLAPDVHGKGPVDALAHARFAHHAATGAVFLGGLEHHANLAVDVVGHVAQDLQGAEHHRDVAIVAARVHAAFVHARELVTRALRHGEGVDVRAHEQAPAGRPVLAVGVRSGAAQGGDEAGLKRPLVGDVHGVELAGDVGSGADLLQAQLGMLVEVAALFDDVGLEFGCDVLDRRGDLVGVALLLVGHDLLRFGLGHGYRLALDGRFGARMCLPSSTILLEMRKRGIDMPRARMNIRARGSTALKCACICVDGGKAYAMRSRACATGQGVRDGRSGECAYRPLAP